MDHTVRVPRRRQMDDTVRVPGRRQMDDTVIIPGRRQMDDTVSVIWSSYFVHTSYTSVSHMLNGLFTVCDI